MEEKELKDFKMVMALAQEYLYSYIGIKKRHDEDLDDSIYNQIDMILEIAGRYGLTDIDLERFLEEWESEQKRCTICKDKELLLHAEIGVFRGILCPRCYMIKMLKEICEKSDIKNNIFWLRSE